MHHLGPKISRRPGELQRRQGLCRALSKSGDGVAHRGDLQRGVFLARGMRKIFEVGRNQSFGAFVKATSPLAPKIFFGGGATLCARVADGEHPELLERPPPDHHQLGQMSKARCHMTSYRW